jgi:hypothetical protein
MDAEGSMELGMRRRHDGRRRAAGRQPRDVHTLWVDRVIPHDLAGDARDQGRLAAIPFLVAGTKPIPALRLIGSARLLGIDNEAIPLFGQEIHAGAGSEIVC